MPKSYLSNKSVEEIVLSRGKVTADHIKKKYKIGSARLNKLWESADLETISWITNAKQLSGGGVVKKRKKFKKRIYNNLKELKKELKNKNKELKGIKNKEINKNIIF